MREKRRMTVAEALKEATRRLKPFRERPRLEAEILLAHHLGCGRTSLLLREREELVREEEFLEGLVEKVLKGQQLLHTLTTELEAGAPPKKGTTKRERKRDEREVVELRRKIGELNEEIKRLRRECRQRKVVRIRSDEEELLKVRRLLEDKERFLRSCEREVSRLRDELIKLKELISRIEGALNAGKIIKKGGEGEPLWKDYVAVPGEFDIKDLVERYREERLKEILAARRTT